MAFKLPFKLPSFDRRSNRASPQTTVMGDAPGKLATAIPAQERRGKSALPLIGHKSANMQLQILGAAAFLFLIALVFVLWQQIRTTEIRDSHRAIIAEMRVFSQVIGKGAIRVTTQGSAADFATLQTGRTRFDKLLGLLSNGGADAGFNTVAVDDELRPDVAKIAGVWKALDSGLDAVLAKEKALKGLASASDATAAAAQTIAKLAETSPALSDIAKSATSVARRGRAVLLLPAPLHLQAVEVLKTDLTTAFQQAEAASKAVDGPAREALEKALGEIGAAGAQIASSIPDLDLAKAGGAKLQPQAEQLASATDNLFQSIGIRGEDTYTTAIIVVSGSMVLLLLVLMLKVFNDDTQFRRQESERQRREAETAKNVTQEAILRLMNEMGDLADGDLTIRATVSEDVTGAIADSVNYTIEELAVLVRRINEAAGQVATASETAQETSNQLLEATERQSHEIQQASEQVLEMAQSMSEVSGNALESARVARQSLEAAQKGAEAVENSIKGMNEIRGQIQETSKRIKRLGESSQEIGEIVELISDITEQTNVLALNAAIQAASAGEAGRGFTVVAEEVQRLAERSGEATKQIAAIVKTIQADTHDAVSAMEYSTQGVVEGAKLSDAAGQALEEISNVSKTLAELIAKISTDTQHQSGVATGVATAMEGIRQVTDQTTDGTKRTAVSIGELADLAAELKGSVAGFKV
ncbi:MAG: methyl-accepting chemotaxis protein [Gammaproteobacteria bacterium]|nr:methyl-accepting chemotaxis protein [Gammaproteobacteria bacterium]MBU1645184.1 methyl-accepting chemotaxis protein [Gammaproteobacteria bacterium]MBU1973421.1 methyl-accepting chemotaxis protein [Gammaproteobacteria bacterium]